MSKQITRCAIYTRKSSEEGLDQEFNSLDAQQEACTAYIASQRHEGWKALPVRYDDGGVSGGTLDRPAMQRLMADIDAGKIDMVVVYKIDRLTRSLADFAKLVERMEAAGCSFVSVTQAFNTSSSMGRLTLNMLLSFAQFEREVTAERIRDKIAASKKKGLWMGGVPPLGYDPHPDPNRRELVVNQGEAKTVRQIFELHQTYGCLNQAMRKANALGLRSKQHVFSTGRKQGGNPFSRGQIYNILRNPIYLGLIRHKEKTWPGKHEAILDQNIWDDVQTGLKEASGRSRGLNGSKDQTGAPIGAAPLLGKFRDETGDLLTPTHTKRHGRRLRYYISNRLISGGTDISGWRLPAPGFERAIANAVADHLTILAKRHKLLHNISAREAINTSKDALELTTALRSMNQQLLSEIVISGQIAKDRIQIKLNGDLLSDRLGHPTSDLNPELLEWDAPLSFRRRGVELKIIAGDPVSTPDQTLIQAMRKAHKWARALRGGTPLKTIASTQGYSASYLARIIPLAGLSPKIQTAIVDGDQPASLTLESLARGQVSLDWSVQERLFGFT